MIPSKYSILGSIAATTALAACSGLPSQTAPAGTAAQNGRNAPASSSWISPQAKKKSLLYVSSVLTGDVYIYSYSTLQLVGTLTGFETPYGLCSDKKGHVWIVNDGASQLVEYAHGGQSPIATLSDSNEYPEGCAVDPTTGNLAVTNFSSNSGSGNLAIFAHAKGTPQTYTDSSIANYRFCGYDNAGNLYLDGASSGGSFAFAELSKGSSSFTTITLGQKIEWPGGVQWDGEYVDVGDTDAGVIYQTNGAGGQIEGSVDLKNSSYVNQFWIVGVSGKKAKPSTVVAPSQDGGDVGIYGYPAGGLPTATISVEEPFGATVSR